MGRGDGITPFDRTYITGTVVNLTAPPFLGPKLFLRWLRNGVPYSNNPITSLTVSEPITMTAVFQGGIPCLHENTLVSMENSKEICINKIRAGDRVIDIYGNPITVIKNIRFNKTQNFVVIRKNAFQSGVPSHDVYIRPDHPIIYKGKEIKPSELIKIIAKNPKNTKNAQNAQNVQNVQNAQNVKLNQSAHVWSLATKERTFVMMSGIPVCTWAYDDVQLNKYDFISF
jgi:hypothetical protein